MALTGYVFPSTSPWADLRYEPRTARPLTHLGTAPGGRVRVAGLRSGSEADSHLRFIDFVYHSEEYFLADKSRGATLDFTRNNCKKELLQCTISQAV